MMCVMLAGCPSLNSRFGYDSTDYSQATELPPLKLPAGSMALSKRYDIPPVPASNTNAQIITNDMPPDYN